jgi:uncharacterized membrane protein YdfJ with MMPL/SSD domain
VVPRLASLAARRPWLVVASASALGAIALALGASTTSRLHPYSAADPGAESVRAAERVHEAIGIDPDAGLVALIEPGGAVRTEAARRKVEKIADRIFLDPAIGLVTTYWSRGDPAMISHDGRATYVIANFATLSDREQQRSAERLREQLGGRPGIGFGAEAPGNVDVKEIVAADIARAELIVFPLLLLLSFWFFRGFVAALLPVLVGGLATAVSLLVLQIANGVVPVSIFALNLVLGLALALAVDYALLVVSRYREEIARHGAGGEALRRTMATAGRTVMFSSLVVAGTLTSLLVFPQRFLYSMGIGGVAVALVAGAAALVVLPAVLALLGERVNSLSPPLLQRRAAAEARPASEGGWYRLSRLVMRRPLSVALASAAALVALALPFAGARFIPVDSSVLPTDAESRRVREALTNRFPPNPTLPLFVVVDGPAGPQGRRIATRIEELPGAARVDGPVPVNPGTSLITVASARDPLSAQSERLVREIRSLESAVPLTVGGGAADHIDEEDGIASRLPVAIAVLCLITLVVLFAMTGSVVLPVKAVIMSLLSLCAAFGALVFVFQEGRLESVLSYDSPGALELSMPLVLLAVGFGVSTDYGVILLSRIKEARDAGATDREAVALGVERTGRVITAAALLLCVAVGALASSRIAFVKELGVGIALAVLIDATIVRALLVPSLMELLGRWNWWAPRPLRKPTLAGGAGRRQRLVRRRSRRN